MTLNEEIVLCCAFRYALGRMTYVVDSVASEIERHVDVLPTKDLNLYRREIIEAKDGNALGMEMDAKRWQQCWVICGEELARRALKK